MMETVEVYIDNISTDEMNDGKAYSILSNNMSDIVANNTTITSTLAMMQKENRMLFNKINSPENKLSAATDKSATNTTKTYTSSGPGPGDTKEWVKGGHCWAHGYGVVPDHGRSMCGIQNKNPRNKDKSIHADTMGGVHIQQRLTQLTVGYN